MILLSLHIAFTLQAQVTLSGYINDAATGESLIGAVVSVKDHPELGTYTNTYGFYSLSLKPGTYTIAFSYIGYETVTKQLNLSTKKELSVELKPVEVQIKTYTVTDKRSDENTDGAQMGTTNLNIEKIKSLPSFLGEVDPLKTIQLLPGIQSAGDGNAGFYVRGGGPDQNLILLDEAVIYNASHLFGFFSVFNPDAIHNVKLIKGSMPANYGGRLASVLDISMKEGNMKKYSVNGGIGLISSRLTVQGPLKKDTGSFIISARRTYIDVVAQPFIPKTSAFYGSGYHFYDLNAKFNYRLGKKDRLFLSAYNGRDVFDYVNDNSGINFKIPWGNSTASLRWNHLFSDKLFLNTTAIFSDFKFEFAAKQGEFDFALFSGIKDWNFKTDFSYYPNIRNKVKFGANYIFHTFVPSNVTAESGEVNFDTGDIIKYYAHDAAVYIHDEYDFSDALKINAGLRFSMFQHIGPFTRYNKDIPGKTDTTSYAAGKPVATYGGAEPRISVRYKLNMSSSLKAGYTHNYQYIHLASLSAVSLPTDIWVPSTDRVKPQIGDQYAVGYFKNFKNNLYESSVEVYYKHMKNQVAYEEGALPEDNIKDNPDNHFVFGLGRSYGAEFFFKKAYGKLNGWIGYTLAWTKRKFPDINDGKVFPAKFDRRHDLSVAVVYNLAKRWQFSTVFVYATGNAITLPVSRYVYEGNIVNEYGPRNSLRMPAYHRLDFSVTFKGKPDKKFKSDWNFSVFNVYNRANPFFIYFDNTGNIQSGTLQVKAKQVSLFPVLPSITWNFKF